MKKQIYIKIVSRSFYLVSVLLFTAYCSLLTVSAQSAEPADVIRVDTDLVNLNASVFNRKSAANTIALQPKDFTVLDDGAPQDISFFAAGESPFDLVLLLDLSGSTANKISLIRKSAKRFVEAARPEDRIAILTFTADIQMVSKLTSDRAALKKSIDGIEKPIGGTNFWDALAFTLDHVAGQSRVEKRRSAVVVMTDGVDNALPGVYGDGSKITFDQLLDDVRHLETIILPIYLDTEKESNPNSTPASAYVMAREQLATLATESGNTVYRARKLKDLNEVYGQVIRDLSTVYSIGYRPANRGHEGAWHTVTLQLVDHPELEVRSKRGYFESKQ
ncbi:MAG TPA: VWA domain-containing protein [Pyrinomonadaceae bacterium]|nr:VWA domain-containing protein [Pyrinomonadaceae bacterium]